MSTPRIVIDQERWGVGIIRVPRLRGATVGMRYRVVRRPSGRAVTGILEDLRADGQVLSLVDEAGRHHVIDACDLISIEVRLH